MVIYCWNKNTQKCAFNWQTALFLDSLLLGQTHFSRNNIYNRWLYYSFYSSICMCFQSRSFHVGFGKVEEEPQEQGAFSTYL